MSIQKGKALAHQRLPVICIVCTAANILLLPYTMFCRHMPYILILSVTCTLGISTKFFNIIPAKYLYARRDFRLNNWIGYNKNLFNHNYPGLEYKTFANIYIITRDRNCYHNSRVLCISCVEFNDFFDKCPKTYITSFINLNVLNSMCSMKAKLISLPIQNYTCTDFHKNGYTYTFS